MIWAMVAMGVSENSTPQNVHRDDEEPVDLEIRRMGQRNPAPPNGWLKPCT